MPISDRDHALLDEISQYYRSSLNRSGQEGSLLATANHFNLSRNKIRKALVTTGDIVSPYTEEAVYLRSQGKSIKEIAAHMGISVATVSTALPYSDKIDNSLEPNAHAASVRQYRAYEKSQAQRQISRRKDSDMGCDERSSEKAAEEKEWQKDIKMSYTETYHRPHRDTWADMEELRKKHEASFSEEDSELLAQLQEATHQWDEQTKRENLKIEELGSKQSLTGDEQNRLSELKHKHGMYPGALNSRHTPILEKIAGGRLPPDPMGVMRLHLELYDPEMLDETSQILRTFGEVKYGKCISRDILVPENIPLYALHYVIQRAFGWQNSHLYEYTLPNELLVPLTNDNTSMWSCLVGVLFQSPFMDDSDDFWADDYEQGSFRNWLRKKYTGPYMSQCHGEGLYSCQSDMTDLDMEQQFYLLYVKKRDHESDSYSDEEYISDVSPVFSSNGQKLPKPKNIFNEEAPSHVEIMPLKALPAEALVKLFERNPFALLKRLPISGVLLPGNDRLSDDPQELEYINDNIAHNGNEVLLPIDSYIHRIIEEGIDSPLVQVCPPAVTGTLYYQYDFGDNWTIKITASKNCPDLVESGRITQAELDRANVKCRETYRPVLLARDGEMLMDDVGGLSGFADFLEAIHPDFDMLFDEYEVEDAKRQKKEYLEWAKGMGWKRKDNSSNFNLL